MTGNQADRLFKLRYDVMSWAWAIGVAVDGGDLAAIRHVVNEAGPGLCQTADAIGRIGFEMDDAPTAPLREVTAWEFEYIPDGGWDARQDLTNYDIGAEIQKRLDWAQAILDGREEPDWVQALRERRKPPTNRENATDG